MKNIFKKGYLEIIITILVIGIQSSCNGIRSTSVLVTTTSSENKESPTINIYSEKTKTGFHTSTISKPPPSTPTASRYYRLLYQRGAGLYSMIIDQYGKMESEYQILDVSDTGGYIKSFDISLDSLNIILNIGLGMRGDNDVLRMFSVETEMISPFGDDTSYINYPTWSPDSNYIAYEYVKTETIRIEPTKYCTQNCQIRYLRLSQGEEHGILSDPIWIDENTMGYFIRRGGRKDFCIGNILTMQTNCLLRDSIINYISVSNDKTTLLFTMAQNEEMAEIFAIDIKEYLESGDVIMTKLSFLNTPVYSPIWSSDNNHVYYIREENSTRMLVYAEYQKGDILRNEQILLESDKLWNSFSLTSDERMAAWVLSESSEADYLCVYPVDIKRPNDRIYCIKDVTYISPQWET